MSLALTFVIAIIAAGMGFLLGGARQRRLDLEEIRELEKQIKAEKHLVDPFNKEIKIGGF